MRMQRHIESDILGYRIERVRRVDARNEVTAQWYEVFAPESDRLLARHAHRAQAQRAIIARELASAPRAAA